MKLKILTFALLSFLISGFAFGQSKLNIAYVNMGKAINMSEEGQKSRKFLEAQANQTRTQLKAKEQEIRQKQAELKSSLMLSPEAKTQKEREIIQMSRALKQEVNKVQKSFMREEKKYTKKIFEDLKKIVDQIAKKKNYDLVLEYGIKQTILFSKFQLNDITDIVVSEYNNLNAPELHGVSLSMILDLLIEKY